MIQTVTVTNEIDSAVWKSAMTFDGYVGLLEKLQAEGKTTGEQTSERLAAAPLNLVRMKRIILRTQPELNQLEGLSLLAGTKFLIITEGWCGDAAQQLPVIENILRALGAESRYILRDENAKIMDLFLTNGSRSIPVVLALDTHFRVMNSFWGPRPEILQKMVMEWKENMSKHEWHEKLHTWYASDKGKTIQNDFIQWLYSLPVAPQTS